VGYRFVLPTKSAEENDASERRADTEERAAER
jgi:hypothetical protein